MPEISITMPSLRPETVLQRIKEFSITNEDSDYEIIVVSPFIVKGDRVVHVYEKEQLGNAPAHKVAYENSTGEYIIYWADDICPTANCLTNMLRFVKSKKGPFIGSFRLRRRGEEKSQWAVYGKLYACVGCVSRNIINLIGGYFAPVYNGYWADPDMCLRVWEKGGRVGVCPDAWVELDNIEDEIRENNWNRYFDKDMKTFLNRWHDKLGRGIERGRVEKDWRIVNKPVGLHVAVVDFVPSFMRPALRKIYRDFVPSFMRPALRKILEHPIRSKVSFNG